jgi:hypothetical protein
VKNQADFSEESSLFLRRIRFIFVKNQVYFYEESGLFLWEIRLTFVKNQPDFSEESSLFLRRIRLDFPKTLGKGGALVKGLREGLRPGVRYNKTSEVLETSEVLNPSFFGKHSRRSEGVETSEV